MDTVSTQWPLQEKPSYPAAAGTKLEMSRLPSGIPKKTTTVSPHYINVESYTSNLMVNQDVCRQRDTIIVYCLPLTACWCLSA